MFNLHSLRNLDSPLPASIGYDLAAEWYDAWHWTEFWRRNELPLVQRLISAIGPRTALDAGTGTGAYGFLLEPFAKSVVGVDISKGMLAVQARKAALRDNKSNVLLCQGDVCKLPKDWTGRFDCVVCARVLSSIQESNVAIKELSRVIRPKGHLIVTDIHPQHPYSYTSIANGRVHSRIVAFKHSLERTEAAFIARGLKIEGRNTLKVEDLAWQPPRDKFDKIYANPANPIFFIYDVVKTLS